MLIPAIYNMSYQVFDPVISPSRFSLLAAIFKFVSLTLWSVAKVCETPQDPEYRHEPPVAVTPQRSFHLHFQVSQEQPRLTLTFL